MESSTSEAFSGRTTPEQSVSETGFVNPLKIEEPVKPWGNKAKLADIVRPRTDSGCQTRNVSECEENNKLEAEDVSERLVNEENHYDHDQQVPVCQANADSEIEKETTTAYSNNTAASQLDRDLALVRNHVGDSDRGVQLFMTFCDEIYNLLLNVPQEVVMQSAQIGQIQV